MYHVDYFHWQCLPYRIASVLTLNSVDAGRCLTPRGNPTSSKHLQGPSAGMLPDSGERRGRV
jgi:hypothetical protein